MTDLINFAHENTAILIALNVLSLLIFYRKPKVFLTLFLFIFIISVTVYLIFNISDTALERKKELIRQSQYSLF